MPSVKLNMAMNMLLAASSIVFPIITLPYVSRALGPEYLGKVYFGNSVVMFFSMLAELGIPVYGIRACAKVRDNRLELTRTVHEILAINLLTCILVYFAIALSVITVPKLIQERAVIAAMSGIIILNALGIEWMYKAIEKYSYITIRSVAFKLIAFISLFALVKGPDDYIIYATISIFAASASNILNIINAHKYIDFKHVGGYRYKRHFKGLLYLFMMAAAVNIYTNMDLAILDFIKGDAVAGCYGLAVKVKVALVSLTTSVSAVLLPRTSFYYEKGYKDEFNGLIASTLKLVELIAIPVVIIFMIFAGEVVYVLGGSEFTDAVLPMRILMPSIFIIVASNIIGMQMLVPMGREKEVAIAAVIGAAVDLALNLLMIPSLGSAGAAIATVAAEICVLVLLIIVVGRKANVKLI